MKKLKNFKLLSKEEQKSFFGGNTSNRGCCDLATECCFPYFGSFPAPSVIEECGLIVDTSCNWWRSTNGCCF